MPKNCCSCPVQTEGPACAGTQCNECPNAYGHVFPLFNPQTWGFVVSGSFGCPGHKTRNIDPGTDAALSWGNSPRIIGCSACMTRVWSPGYTLEEYRRIWATPPRKPKKRPTMYIQGNYVDEAFVTTVGSMVGLKIVRFERAASPTTSFQRAFSGLPMYSFRLGLPSCPKRKEIFRMSIPGSEMKNWAVCFHGHKLFLVTLFGRGTPVSVKFDDVFLHTLQNFLAYEQTIRNRNVMNQENARKTGIVNLPYWKACKCEQSQEEGTF